MLPKRTRQHRLESESRKAFEAVLPSRHVFRPEHSDYGIDGEVEEFDNSDQATGRRFRVQLKGTDKTGPSAMRERIKLSTAAYYRAQQLPVLMVRYLATTEQLFGRWFHEFDPYYEHTGTKYLTFHWSDTDLLTGGRFDDLFGQVAQFARIRSARLDPPVTVRLGRADVGVHSSAPAELDVAVETAMQRAGNVLAWAGPDDRADLDLVIEEDQIQASLAGVASVTFHLDAEIYSSETAPAEVATDLMNAAAVALARAGHGDPAGRLAVEFFAGSAFSAVAPVAVELGAAMSQAGRVIDVIEIADALDKNEEPSCQASGAALMSLVRELVPQLRPYEHQRFEDVMRARLDRRLVANLKSEAAAAAENLGFYLLSARRPADAIEPLEQSITLDPARETSDLLAALAGAYFLSDRYSESASTYERARARSRETDLWLEARYADALVYSGRYREALKIFSAIDSPEIELAAWAYVKTRALSWMLNATGIEVQDRRTESASELAGRWAEMEPAGASEELASQVWRLDAMSALGWFNHARDLLDRGLEAEAMHAYLLAAVMQEGDVEAWVNVALLASNTDDDELFAASVISGHRLNRESYLAEFARQLRTTVGDLSLRNELLDAVREITQLDEQ